jgi:hypothetical protein
MENLSPATDLTGPLTLHDHPTESLHAATKEYADNASGGAADHQKLVNLDKDDHSQYAPISVVEAGDPDPTENQRTGQIVVRKGVEVDEGVEFVQKQGGQMTGPLLLQGLPSSANEATTKAYVDSAVSEARPVLRGMLANKAIPNGGTAGTKLDGTLTIYQNDGDHYSYNSSTGVFTVAESGLYLVSLRYFFNRIRTSATQRHFMTCLNDSGSVLARQEMPYNDQWAGLTTMYRFGAGAWWYFDAFQETGATGTATSLNVHAVRVGKTV